MKKIMLCDCNVADCPSLVKELETEFSVKLCTELKDVAMVADSFSPDVVLCGEGKDGTPASELIKSIRKCSNAPIILIVSDKSKLGFPWNFGGACDFIFTPIRSDELIARIEKQLSENMPCESKSVFVNGNLTVDYEGCKAYANGKPLHLTLLEYKLICLLSNNCGITVTYENIMSELWSNPIGNEILSLRVFVTSIRKKLKLAGVKENYLRTCMGKGYCMPVM